MKYISVGGGIAAVILKLLLDGLVGYSFPLNIKLRGPPKMSEEFGTITKIFLVQTYFLFVQK